MFTIPLPSGLIFEASPLYGRDLQKIAERVGGNASGETIVAFMQSACHSVVDAGPYPFLEGGAESVPWPQVLWGDLLYAVIKLRIESFPEHKGTFEFEFSCPHCRHLSGGSIDLAEMLVHPDHFQPLPEKSKALLLANDFPSFKLPSGPRVSYDFARSSQDVPMRTLMQRNSRKKETDVEVITKRLKSVEGLKDKNGEPKKDLLSLWRWAGGLSTNDIDALLQDFKETDIMVDTKILAWCDNNEGQDCGRQVRIPLPLGQSFFRPRTATKRVSTEQGEPSEPSSPESIASGGSS